MKYLYLFLILFGIVLLLNPSNVLAVNLPGQECIFTNTVETSVNNSIVFIDMSSSLPGNAEFNNGTTGWKPDTSGGGQVLSYPLSIDTYGEIGLRCGPGQTAVLDITSTISVSTSGATYEWDYITVCVHYRANTTANNSNRIAAGKFSLELHDAYDTEVHDIPLFDNSNDTTVVNTIGTNTTFVTFADQFAPLHHNWFAMTHLKLVYSVPANIQFPTTEMLVERVVFSSGKFIKSP